MNGAIAIFLSASFIDFFYYLSHCRINFLVAEDFLCGIHEKHIQTALDGQVVLLLSIAFAYSSFEEIALYGTFEKLLRNGYHDPVLFFARTFPAKISHARHIAVLSFGKKLRDAGLAAQSFFLRKSIRSCAFHF